MTLADQPWVEKYRPKTFNEISAQENTLKSLTVTDNLPHLLFYGPPGSGKTTTILAYCRSLSESMDFVLELNASDERGIDMIRTKVKYFAKTITKRPFKIIILDEADSLTKDAQSALRRIMELYSKTTRFCLICNYLSRVIDPLASRCAKFRFQALPTAAIASRLEYIVEQEAVSIQPQVSCSHLGLGFAHSH
jgi:replication factor C subunit 2/4